MLRGTFPLIQPFSALTVVCGKFEVLYPNLGILGDFPLKRGCRGLKMAQNEFLRELGASSRKSVREGKMPYGNAYPAKKELGQNSRRCSSYNRNARRGRGCRGLPPSRGGIVLYCPSVVETLVQFPPRAL